MMKRILSRCRCCHRKEPEIRCQVVSFEACNAFKIARRLLEGHSLTEPSRYVDEVIAGVAILGMIIEDAKYSRSGGFRCYPHLTEKEVFEICQIEERYDIASAILKIGERALNGKLGFDGTICTFPYPWWFENLSILCDRIRKYYP